MDHQISINGTGGSGRGRIDQFSWMRIVACFAIIILHELYASTTPNYFGSVMSEGDKMFEGIAQHMLMWAVPVFLMITGALQLDPNRELTVRKIFSKYIRRVALALVVFTLIFSMLDWAFDSTYDGTPFLVDWIKDLFLGRSWAHMWYIYLLIAIYLLLPFFRAGWNHMDDAGKKYLLIVLLIFNACVAMINAVMGVVGGEYKLGIALGLHLYTIYPAYLFLGDWLLRHRMKLPAAIALTAVCSAVIIIFAIVQRNVDQTTSNMLDCIHAYNSIFVVGQAVGAYAMMLYIKAPAGKLVRTVDDCTFGIYIIHMIGIHLIMKWLGWNPYLYGPMAFLMMAIVLFAASFAVTWAIRKIPKIGLL